MKATISNFRSSKHRQKDTHMIIIVDGVKSKDDAGKLVGKKVVFTTEGGKEIAGKVASAHGNSGAIRAIFEKGMPGQSIAKNVRIE